MSLVERYELLNCLHDGPAIAVYRARERQGGATVVLKMQKPGTDVLSRLRHEHDILKDLMLPGVIHTRGLEKQGGEVALVLDDVGGAALSARLAHGALPLAKALSIAIEVADTLGHIHHRRVIHKDINPSNILLDGADRARVFDFDIATRLPREIQNLRAASQLAGTLPYISPEQTGRMNRTIDYRTDLYSFGVTLYQMLTGRVPFSSRDPIELIHHHIAKTPTPPSELDRTIPPVVSDIVMKLLAKTAEERYQSAFGLKADLEQCQQMLSSNGRVETFVLGSKDVSDRFQIAQKLYGREPEIAALEGAFARASTGTPELLLVSGSSGIGKSSVIHELYRSLSQSRGYFVSGKFEELKRDIPYSALLQASSELVRSVLAEPDEQLAVIRGRLQAAVRDAGGVLASVLPDITRILGPQPPAPALPGSETKNRFRYLFARFLQVFTRHGQPLVVFLDDLQWADAATLDVVTSLLSDRDAGELLFIGAYRDNEVTAGHPLLACLSEIEKEGCAITRIALGPIGVEQVSQLLEDTISLAPGEAQPFAELLVRRTLGNPFFVGELLTVLHKNGLIEFEPARLRWTFDLAQIEREKSTESVGQLMAARVGTLSAPTQEVLQLAAVIGNRFELDTLGTIAQRPQDEVAMVLEEALREGLVLPIGQEPRVTYRFLHDRVQRAVYESIPDSARVEVHHRTGELLLRSPPDGETEEWLFEVIHHLNLAAERVTDPEQRVNLARLNHKAAERAGASGAFAAAADHYAAGIGFLPATAWTSHHELMFMLNLGLGESKFLHGDHAAAERLFEHLHGEARSDAEQVRVYEQITTYKAHTGKYQEALESALKALDLLGIKMGPDPKAPMVLVDFLMTKRALMGKSTDELLNLPEATEPGVLLAYRTLAVAVLAAFYTNPILYVRLGLKLTRMVIEHGNSLLSATGYGIYAMILVGFGDYAAADTFGRLALQLTERYPNKRVETAVNLFYGGAIHLWRNPIRESLRYLEEAYQCGLLSGELTFTASALRGMVQSATITGVALDVLVEIAERNRHLCRRIKEHETEQSIRVNEQAALALQGRTGSLGSFETDDFNEARYVAEVSALGTKFFAYGYWVTKVAVLHVLERHEEALAMSARIRKDADQVLGFLCELVTYRFHDALLIAAFAGTKSALGRQRDILLIRGHLRKLKKWADNAPQNYRHRYLLVSAELSRVREDDHAAIAQYQESIKLARENEFPNDEALALELASKFYRSRGLPDFAIIYLVQARQAYKRWGAFAKVELLDQTYPGLSGRAELTDVAATTHRNTSRTQPPASRTFDIHSMVKASQALSGEITVNKLLLRLMNVVAENAGAERGALVLKHKGEFAVVAEFSVREGAHLPERPLPIVESDGLSLGIVKYVLRMGEGVILGDASRAGAFTTDAYVARRNPKAVLCTPLSQTGEVRGAIYLENNLVSGAFTPERAELLSVLCAQMAISIDNAHLYADLEQKVVERTRALQEAQARLVQLEKEATEMRMAGGFAHEMRNALAGGTIMMTAIYREGDGEQPWSLSQMNNDMTRDVLLRVGEEISGPTRAQISGILKKVDENGKRIEMAMRGVVRSLTRGLRITDMILEYAQLGGAFAGSDEVPARALVSRVLDELMNDLTARRIAVEVNIAEQCSLIGDEKHFHGILMHLIVNAREALEAIEVDGGRAIRIDMLEERARQVLSVSDTGIGIPAELQEKIFEPFFTTKVPTGTGLGLGVVRKLASLYGGVIEVESEPGRGATFRVILPAQMPPTVP